MVYFCGNFKLETYSISNIAIFRKQNFNNVQLSKSEFCQKYFKELNYLSNIGNINVFLLEKLDQNIFLSEKSQQKYKEYFNELK